MAVYRSFGMDKIGKIDFDLRRTDGLRPIRSWPPNSTVIFVLFNQPPIFLSLRAFILHISRSPWTDKHCQQVPPTTRHPIQWLLYSLKLIIFFFLTVVWRWLNALQIYLPFVTQNYFDTLLFTLKPKEETQNTHYSPSTARAKSFFVW